LLGLVNRPNDNSRDGHCINALRHTIHAIIYKVHLCTIRKVFLRAGDASHMPLTSQGKLAGLLCFKSATGLVGKALGRMFTCLLG